MDSGDEWWCASFLLRADHQFDLGSLFLDQTEQVGLDGERTRRD